MRINPTPLEQASVNMMESKVTSKCSKGSMFPNVFLIFSRQASNCVSQLKCTFFFVKSLSGALTKAKLGVHFQRQDNIPIKVKNSCRHLGDGSDNRCLTRSGSGTIVTLPVGEVDRASPAKMAVGPTLNFSIKNLKFSRIALIIMPADKS